MLDRNDFGCCGAEGAAVWMVLLCGWRCGAEGVAVRRVLLCGWRCGAEGVAAQPGIPK